MASNDQGGGKALGPRARAAEVFETARERTASNQQDQYYYGQRSASAQPPQAPGNAYAPRPSYGPFGSGRGL